MANMSTSARVSSPSRRDQPWKSFCLTIFKSTIEVNKSTCISFSVVNTSDTNSSSCQREEKKPIVERDKKKRLESQSDSDQSLVPETINLSSFVRSEGCLSMNNNRWRRNLRSVRQTCAEQSEGRDVLFTVPQWRMLDRSERHWFDVTRRLDHDQMSFQWVRSRLKSRTNGNYTSIKRAVNETRAVQ